MALPWQRLRQLDNQLLSQQGHQHTRLWFKCSQELEGFLLTLYHLSLWKFKQWFEGRAREQQAHLLICNSLR